MLPKVPELAHKYDRRYYGGYGIIVFKSKYIDLVDRISKAVIPENSLSCSSVENIYSKPLFK